MRLTSCSAIRGWTVLLNSSSFGIHSPLYASKLNGSAGTGLQTTKYSRVQFRKGPDGTIVAFENCGCEAEANTFRPCRMHRGNAHQAARLKAEARYHSIQKCCQQPQGSTTQEQAHLTA
jgi:hypothetical protein